MKNRLLYVFAGLAAAVLLGAVPSYAQMSEAEAKEIFVKGNNYYDAGEFGKAIGAYQEILDTGIESGALYYDLANAYFKSGNKGKAILNYERASRLIPRDADLKANYRYARAGVKDRVLAKPSFWDWGPLNNYYSNRTINEITLTASGTYVLLVIFIGISIAFPVIRRQSVTLAMVAVIFLVVNVAVLFYKVDMNEGAAVVTVPAADAMYGPFESATKFFAVSEGVQLKVLEMKQDWVKVERADGKVGWLKRGDVETV